MTITTEITMEHTHTVGIRGYKRQILPTALKVGRFILHLLEMTLSMMVGMVALYLLDGLVSDSSGLAPYFEYGRVEFDFAMAIFMTVPMAGWMLLRRHDRRHVVGMSLGMNALVAVIIVLRLLGADASQPWLADSSHPAMFLGMLAAMLFSREHYTGKAGHSAHLAHHHTH